MSDYHKESKNSNQEESTEKKNLYRPTHLKLEQQILECDEIPWHCKCYFGFLCTLSYTTKEIYLTDVSLAEMMGVSLSIIEKWNKLLKKNGFFESIVRTIKYGEASNGKPLWRVKRKILIDEEPNKKSLKERLLQEIEEEERIKKELKKEYETAKNEGIISSKNVFDTVKNYGIDYTVKNYGIDYTVKNYGHKETTLNPQSKKDNNTKTAPSAPVPPSPSAPCIIISLEESGLSEDHKKVLYKKHSREDLERAVPQAIAYLKTGSVKSLYAAFNVVLKHKATWEAVVDKESIEEENKKYLQELSNLDGKKIGSTDVNVGYNYIEFTQGSANKMFKITDNNFSEHVESYLNVLYELQYPHKSNARAV